MMSAKVTRTILRALDAAALLWGGSKERAVHLETGARGEQEAYFHLRQLGYIMVARNWRSPRRKGELDLIGWEGDTLCFIEVKTRTAHDLVPAEAAVDREKRDDLRRVAKEYLLRLEKKPPIRFDVVSVYMLPGKPVEIELFRGAFSLSGH